MAVKTIIMAYGFEGRDHWGEVTINFLNEDAEKVKGKDFTWTYPKGAAAAKITHEVRLVFTMPEFTAALDTADAYVVYEGHSRYGQGPAFGPPRPGDMPWSNGKIWVPDKKTAPVNPWGQHFRMGYDATDTECIDDLLEHSITPTEYDLTAVPSKAFLPKSLVDAIPRVERTGKAISKSKPKIAAICRTDGAWRSFADCYSKLEATTTARGDQPLKGRHYYADTQPAYRRKKDITHEFLTAVNVGSADLDKSSLTCQFLFMASCSSHPHFFAALERRRKAAKSTCKFMMTGVVCSAFNGKTFLSQMLLKGLDPVKPGDGRKILNKLNGFGGAGAIDIY
jgi:hypothetical protein